jgi:hypothetical protein
VKVSHSGSFASLPLFDKVKIVTVFPFMVVAAVGLGTVMAAQSGLTSLAERFVR